MITRSSLSSSSSRWIAGYFIAQVVIAFLCIVLFYQPDLPLPPPEYRLTRGEVSIDGNTWTETSLPYYRPRDISDDVPTLIRAWFERSADDATRTWSIFIPRFTSGLEIMVNGTVILDSRRTPSLGRVDRNFAVIAAIPDTLLHNGVNELVVRLHLWGPLTGYLATPYAGPDAELRQAYDGRVFLFATLPLALAIWQAMVGMILGLIFLARRHEKAYGWLAAAMVVGTAQHFIPLPGSPLLHGLLGAFGTLECALSVHFAAHLTGMRISPWGRFLFLPAALIVLASTFGSLALLRVVYGLVGLPSIGLFVFMVAAILGRAAIREQDWSFAYLGSTMSIVAVFWVHDALTAVDALPGERILLGRISYSTVLIAIGLGLTWRFVQALNQADNFTAQLVHRVRESEEKLRASFAREEEQNRKETLAAERGRLMHDLHDGLGGQLVSIVAMAEQTGKAQIGDAARGALRDLRLVIDAMEDVEGDLMLVLGSWRERMAAQLRAHDITLSWQVMKPEGLPIFPDLRPWHVIQIVRLLDEAVTNAIKHSGARTLKVVIDTIADDAAVTGGSIVIEDDGNGFDAKSTPADAGHRLGTGRGLVNMRKRAEFCGATLDIVSGATGTRIDLWLPISIGAVASTDGRPG